jgi:NCS1 family nucleobase:cation symporter-1
MLVFILTCSSFPQFYFLQLPLLWIHISKLRYLFLAKVIIMPIFGITLFAWSVKEAGGFGPLWSQPTQIKASDGRPAAVVFMSSISAAIAPKAT